MDADLDTLAIALYARVGDVLKDHPELVPRRPKVGIAPKPSDAELLTLAVLQVLQGFNEEARWLRHADKHLRHLFPYLPGQAGYNKRLRKSAGQLQALIRILGQDTDVWADDTWLIDSTPELRQSPTGLRPSTERRVLLCSYCRSVTGDPPRRALASLSLPNHAKNWRPIRPNGSTDQLFHKYEQPAHNHFFSAPGRIRTSVYS